MLTMELYWSMIESIYIIKNMQVKQVKKCSAEETFLTSSHPYT